MRATRWVHTRILPAFSQGEDHCSVIDISIDGHNYHNCFEFSETKNPADAAGLIF